MPVRVIDLLKVVNVNESERESLLLARPGGKQIIRALVKCASVHQPRQAIGSRLGQITGDLSGLGLQSLFGVIQPLLQLLIGAHNLGEHAQHFFARRFAFAASLPTDRVQLALVLRYIPRKFRCPQRQVANEGQELRMIDWGRSRFFAKPVAEKHAKDKQSGANDQPKQKDCGVRRQCLAPRSLVLGQLEGLRPTELTELPSPLFD